MLTKPEHNAIGRSSTSKELLPETFLNLIPENYRGRSHIRRKEASEITGLSINWFERAAWEGYGPPMVKIESRPKSGKKSADKGAVLYPVTEFFKWFQDRLVSGASVPAKISDSTSTKESSWKIGTHA